MADKLLPRRKPGFFAQLFKSLIVVVHLHTGKRPGQSERKQKGQDGKRHESIA